MTGLGIDRLRLKLRIMSDDDLWWVFLNHREECAREFWDELETRKAAGNIIQRQSILGDGRTRKLPPPAKFRQ